MLEYISKDENTYNLGFLETSMLLCERELNLLITSLEEMRNEVININSLIWEQSEEKRNGTY